MYNIYTYNLIKVTQLGVIKLPPKASMLNIETSFPVVGQRGARDPQNSTGYFCNPLLPPRKRRSDPIDESSRSRTTYTRLALSSQGSTRLCLPNAATEVVHHNPLYCVSLKTITNM